jgi:tetratricopeptide (TPR) repeat protein
MNQDAEALEIFEELQAKSNYFLGEDHPVTLNSLSWFAGFLSRNGDNDRALQMEEECYEKRKQVLGEDHPQTESTLYDLANLLERMGASYDEKGQHDRAMELYERALPMYVKLEALYTSVHDKDDPHRIKLRDIITKLRRMMPPEIFNPAAGGGKKKRHFRKSKKSKRTKQSRSVRRSRNRKGGMMSNHERKEEIKKLALTEDKKGIDSINYTANYDSIYRLWNSLESEENKKQFEEEFVKAANTLFTNHSYRVPLYKRIIADLRATDSHIKQHPEDLEMHKSPPNVEVTDRAGGKSRRRRNRRSSKKYRKVRKSRRRARS